MTASIKVTTDELNEVKAFIQTIYPNPDELIMAVPPDVQQQELDNLRRGLRNEQFFFIVDFPKLRIIEASGLEEMGYDSQQFTFEEYLTTVPAGGALQLVIQMGKQTFRFSEHTPVSFMNPKLVANVPMIAADGQVMLLKRVISPWQHTDTGQITAYVSEYTIIKPYENEPMLPRFINLNTAVEADFSREMARLFARHPMPKNPFSPKELVLMKRYIDAGQDGLPVSTFAEQAGITIHTLHTHNRNILKKAKALFGQDLPVKTARDVAEYMKKSGLLG